MTEPPAPTPEGPPVTDQDAGATPVPSEKFMRQHYGASGYVEQKPYDVCSRCFQNREQHFGLNFADGPHVSGAVLVCPTAVFFNNQPAVKADD